MMPVIRFGGGDVEGGVVDGDPLGRGPSAEALGDFERVALLDRDARSVGQRQVEGARRRRDVERDPVRLGEQGHAVGADLVGGVAVGGDPIGADDDRLDLAFLHDLGGHVVADQGDRDAAVLQFPGGEPGTLEQRPGLVGEDVDRLALLVGREDHGERRAVVGRGQAAGVAVGQDAVARRQQLGAVAADGPAHGAVLVGDRVGLGQQPFQQSPAPRRSPGRRPRLPSDRAPRTGSRRSAGWSEGRRRLPSRGSGSIAGSSSPCARAPMTAPYAAATPIAGAPRTLSRLIASQTAAASRQSISTHSPGSRVWSIIRRKPLDASPIHDTVGTMGRTDEFRHQRSTPSSRRAPQPSSVRCSFFVLVLVVILVVLLVLFRVDPGIELGEDVPDVPQALRTSPGLSGPWLPP